MQRNSGWSSDTDGVIEQPNVVMNPNLPGAEFYVRHASFQEGNKRLSVLNQTDFRVINGTSLGT